MPDYSTLPEDAMNVAAYLIEEETGHSVYWDDFEDMQKVIALAITQERSRCISLVKDMAEYEGSDFGLIEYIEGGWSLPGTKPPSPR